MASGCAITSRAGLCVVGFVFWAVASALFFVGGWVFNSYRHYDEITEANLTLIPASIVLAVGILMFVIGIICCVAACKENKCLLAVLFSLLLVILTAEVAAGAIGYALRNDVVEVVKNGLQEAIDRYNGTEKDQMDYVQENLKCCGLDSPKDWLTSKMWSKYHKGVVPESCCVFDYNCTEADRIPRTKSAFIYNQGCFEKVDHEFMSNLAYIAGTAIAVAVIQIFGMICSCVLFCRTKEVQYEALGGQYPGLRV